MQVAVSIIPQTGGHGDGFYPCCVDLGFFGLRLYDVPDGVADGVDEVRKAAREILRAGADWIKLATTGGGISTSDAPTSAPLTREEISTAVREGAPPGKLLPAHQPGSPSTKKTP